MRVVVRICGIENGKLESFWSSQGRFCRSFAVLFMQQLQSKCHQRAQYAQMNTHTHTGAHTHWHTHIGTQSCMHCAHNCALLMRLIVLVTLMKAFNYGPMRACVCVCVCVSVSVSVCHVSGVISLYKLPHCHLLHNSTGIGSNKINNNSNNNKATISTAFNLFALQQQQRTNERTLRGLFGLLSAKNLNA